MLANLLVPLAGLVDAAMLGHLADERHLAGVGLAGVIFDYLYWGFGFLRMGVTAITAQALGRRDAEEVILTVWRGGAWAVVFGVGVLLLQWPLRELSFWFLQGPEAVEAAGREYYAARIWGAPATLINFVIVGWLVGRERILHALALSLLVNGANVALDYLFIKEWGWASAGAGWATTLAQYLMLVAGLIVFAFERPFGRAPRPAGPRGIARALEWRPLLHMMALGRDLLIRTLLLVTTFAIFINLGSLFGATVLAANVLIFRIQIFVAYLVDGYALATETLAGVFAGRGDRVGLTRVLRLSVWASLGTGLAVAFAVIAAPSLVLGLLTDITAVQDAAGSLVWWLLPIVGVGSIAFALDGYFIGLTAGRVLRRAMFWSVLVGFVPAAVVGWWLRSNWVLWLAMAGFMVGRVVSLGWFVPRTLRTAPDGA